MAFHCAHHVLLGSGLRWINQPVQRVCSETITVPTSRRRAGPVVGEPSAVVFALHAGLKHQALCDALAHAGGSNVVDDQVGENDGSVESLDDWGTKRLHLGGVAP